MGPLTLGLTLFFILLALLPTRRLRVAGVGAPWLALYMVVLVGLGLLTVELEVLARYLVPVDLLVFLFPFAGIVDRWRRMRLPPGTATSRRGKEKQVIVDGKAVRIDPDAPREP